MPSMVLTFLSTDVAPITEKVLGNSIFARGNRKINHEILRAVPHASVLSDHGKHLRNSDGDEHTYNLSHRQNR